MISRPANIYIDEFGNIHLDLSKKGTFSHFIYTSFIIPQDLEEDARKVRNELSKKYKQGSALKSNRFGEKDFEKRLSFLKEFSNKLDFTIDVLVIDKSKLSTEGGFSYKRVFYKYFQSLFVQKYSQKYDSFKIYADKVGEEFRYELQQYVRKHATQRDLFHPDRNFSLVDDVSEEPLVQLTDMLCGSVGKIFCSSHIHQRASEIYEILHTRLSVEFFPFHTSILTNLNIDKEIDAKIKSLSFDIIEKFVGTIGNIQVVNATFVSNRV